MHYKIQSWNLATTNIREIASEVRDDVKLEYARRIQTLDPQTVYYIRVW